MCDTTNNVLHTSQVHTHSTHSVECVVEFITFIYRYSLISLVGPVTMVQRGKRETIYLLFEEQERATFPSGLQGRSSPVVENFASYRLFILTEIVN